MPDDGPLDPLPLPRPVAPSGASELRDRFDALRRDPRVAVAVLLAIALAAGVYWFRSGIAAPPAPGGKAAAVATTVVAATTTEVPAESADVVVHVAGAVAKPGLVTLAGGSRVADAIDAAGGAAANADLDRLNLAALLADGQRVAVARRGQPAPPLDPAAGAEATAAADGSATASGPINLNAATQAELEALPGIGPTLAGAIIEERERAGGFTAVADLRRVPGIGDARFAQVESLVTV
jgi:competence protein ComEA